MNTVISVYWKQYRLLEKQIEEVSEYISIDKKNFATFSDRLLLLYQAICGNVDSVADELCKMFEIPAKERFGIANKVERILERFENLKHWRCSINKDIHIQPFVKFDETNTAEWWQGYNKVKHFLAEKDENGNFNYELANLKNVLFALAALYLLIYKLNGGSAENDRIEICSDLFFIEVI